MYFFLKKKYVIIIFASYLKKNLFIYPRFLIKPIWDLLNILSQKTKIFDSHFAYIKKNKKDGYEYYNPNNKCIMSLSNQDMINGDNFLNSIGIKKNTRYVCLNIHDNYFLEKEFPNQNWNHHNVRISNIENYKESIKFLNSKGIFVIRMGRHTRKKLDIKSKLFYDYSFSKFKNDMLDFFLI